MLRAAERPCIPNRKIKARIGTLPTPTPTRLYGARVQMCWCNRTHRRNGNTNKGFKTRVRCTVLFVRREVGGTHTSKEEAVWRGLPVYRCKARCAAGRSTVTRAPPALSNPASPTTTVHRHYRHSHCPGQ